MWMACLLINSCLGMESDSPEAVEARTRAAVAVALELSRGAAPRSRKGEELPWVRVYSPDFPCPACEQVKADARRGMFPFQLIWGTAPPDFEVECYPTFHWNDVRGRGYRWPPIGSDDAYPGAENFLAIWKKSGAR